MAVFKLIILPSATGYIGSVWHLHEDNQYHQYHYPTHERDSIASVLTMYAEFIARKLNEGNTVVLQVADKWYEIPDSDETETA